MIISALKYASSAIYGNIQALRAYMYAAKRLRSHKLPCKVVCVGNLTAGGTGKTPMIMYLARLLQKRGVATVILSRGYKGALEQTGGLVSDTDKVLLKPEDAGDEPYLLACRLKGVPVYVGRKRYANGLKAIQAFNPKVILLDDGYQHLQLQRDMNLLLMDATRPLDNGYVIPRGMLREKPNAINRAQAIVFTRGLKGLDSYGMVAPYVISLDPLPHFVSGHKAYCYMVKAQTDLAQAFFSVDNFNEPVQMFAEQRPKVFAFSGIAKNQSFLDSLEHAGLQTAGFRFYGDHYAYSDKDLEELQKAARAANADALATTEKDHAKLKGRLQMDLVVFGVQMDFFDKEDAFSDYFFKALGLGGTTSDL